MRARNILALGAAAGLAALVSGCKSEPAPVKPAEKTEVEASITPWEISADVRENNKYVASLYWWPNSDSPRLIVYLGEEPVVFEAMDITNPSVNRICLGYGHNRCVELNEETLQYTGLFQKASERVKAICEKADCEGLYKRWQNKQYTILEDIENAL